MAIDDAEGKEIKCPFCKGKDKSCDKCEGKGTLTFKIAGNEELEHFQQYVDMVMGGIEKVFKIGGAWITDESSVGDFMHTGKVNDDIALLDLSAVFGFRVQAEDRIVTVAKRLKKHIEDVGGLDAWAARFE